MPARIPEYSHLYKCCAGRGEKARMTIGAEKYYVLGYDELNLPPDEPETQFDTTDIGTSIWLTPGTDT